MKIGIPKEIQENETRVALVPQSVKKITQKGIEVLIETNAGKKAFYQDKEYEEAGAKIIENPQSLYWLEHKL